MRKNLDMDCLRTFVTIVDAGSFAVAAQRVGRTASAVSLQISRLEDQVDCKLFQKIGRRMVPSLEGERLLSTARQVLDLNDQVMESLSRCALSGEVHIGAVQDFANSILPLVLAKFRSFYPDVRITAKVDRSQHLIDEVLNGTLDLAIAVAGLSKSPHKQVRREKMLWLGADDFILPEGQPIPLVVFEPPCSFRRAAIEALDGAGLAWEIVFISPSLSGLQAAVAAGLGVTVRTASSILTGVVCAAACKRLPKLPFIDFAVYANSDLSNAGVRVSEIFFTAMQDGDFGS